jgi:hypothetical protein
MQVQQVYPETSPQNSKLFSCRACLIQVMTERNIHNLKLGILRDPRLFDSGKPDPGAV